MTLGRCRRKRIERRSNIAMQVIPVRPYPIKGHPTAAAAIAATQRHPLQARARADPERLGGSDIIDATWTDEEFVIRFAHGLYLRIFVDGESVDWRLEQATRPWYEGVAERVGAVPVICRWQPDFVDVVMDRSAMVAMRRGITFEKLFVNELGLLVYCKGQRIWWFQSVHRIDLNKPFLLVTEGE